LRAVLLKVAAAVLATAGCYAEVRSGATAIEPAAVLAA
jgi:hypothetical protein